MFTNDADTGDGGGWVGHVPGLCACSELRYGVLEVIVDMARQLVTGTLLSWCAKIDWY